MGGGRLDDSEVEFPLNKRGTKSNQLFEKCGKSILNVNGDGRGLSGWTKNFCFECLACLPFCVAPTHASILFYALTFPLSSESGACLLLLLLLLLSPSLMMVMNGDWWCPLIERGAFKVVLFRYSGVYLQLNKLETL